MGITGSKQNGLPKQSKSSKKRQLSNDYMKKKAVVLGIEGAGKTTLVQKLKYGEPQNIKPTIGFNLESLRYEGLELMVFDIAGGARSMWGHYLDNSDIIIYVFDASYSKAHDTIIELLKSINKEVKERKCLFICVLNKCDLQNAISNQEFLNEYQVYDHIDSDMFLIRTSNVTGEGLPLLLKKISSYYMGSCEQ